MKELLTISDQLSVEIESLPSAHTVRGGGTAKVGLKESVSTVIESTEEQFQSAIHAAIRLNVQTFLAALSVLEQKPDEFELSFGLKMGGELGNVIVSKISAEATYGVKMSWKSVPKLGPSQA
jgi:hypothetical protein